MATRIRRDVWNLSKVATWEPTLLWYAKGIREMQKRGIADPTSWRYQAAIHDYDEFSEELRDPADKLPTKAEQTKYWKQCQHFTWFFLPWHRWYLLFFEQMVADAVVKAGGPAGWSLPYWNYSDDSNDDALKLPPAFTAKKLPDGTPNPLRVENRERGNDNQPVGDFTDTDLRCLNQPKYQTDPPGGSPGFGGPKTKFNHGSGRAGMLERAPHGSMHNAVGDWMGGFSTAGLDPIFWLHHANIDRLWVVWRNRDVNHVDPPDKAWPKMSFPFRDAAKKAVTRLAGDAVDTVKLGYEYEDVSDPLSAGMGFAAAPVEVRVPRKKVQPEMVGASEKKIPLGRRTTSASVAVDAPAGPALAAAADATSPQRVFLNIENIKGAGTAKNYEVYVNIPEGVDPHQRRDLFVGMLPLFGVREASRKTAKHAGDGVHHTFDITDIAQRMQGTPGWDPENLKVTFVPKGETQELGLAAAEEEEEPAFEVGRVSLYIA
jgi:tyrosinase